MDDSAEQIAADVQAVSRISAVPTLLQVLCDTTGMGFAAVARVTEGTWTACAVQDNIAFGLQPGGQLDVSTTLCIEVRQSREPIVIDHASRDPKFCEHHTPRFYKIESYVSVPILLSDGRYFGNLCAIDPRPAQVSEPRTISMFTRFAELIGAQLESELAREKVQAALLDERATSELREQFIAILGHDLRNPLSAIAASSEVLMHKLSDPSLQSMASRIRTNARRMSSLIDDVLDFARGRLGGGIGVFFKDLDDTAERITSVVHELQDAHPERRIEASISVPCPIRCDPGRLQQLVSNLLANALTHGSPGAPIELDVRVDGGELVLEVWNQGEPIPAESLHQIFGPFWRQSTSATRQGLGLGLHICSQIVRAHGGTLTVTSTSAEGTRFVARLPTAVGIVAHAESASRG